MSVDTIGKRLLNISAGDFDVDFEISDGDLQKIFDANIKHHISTPNAGNLYDSLTLGLFVIPPFQRKFVWSYKQVSYFALSVLKGIPIPPLYTYTSKEKQVLIDGQQRITSLFLYFNDLYVADDIGRTNIDFEKVDEICREYEKIENQLEKINNDIKENKVVNILESVQTIEELNEEKLKLKDTLKKDYHLEKKRYLIKQDKTELDISFSCFSKRDRQIIKNRDFYVTEISCLASNQDTSQLYMNIFGLLNSAGKQLNSQEIRNGIFWDSKLYSALSIFNDNNKIWRLLYVKPSMYSKDLELLLKMLSLEACTTVNNNKLMIREDLKYTWNWSNIMLHFSEDTSKIEKPELYISKLERFFSALKGSITAECHMAVLEAIFVAWTKVGNGKDISFEVLSNIGETKKIKFPKIESGKKSVNIRLEIAYKMVLGTYVDNNEKTIDIYYHEQ